jgi:DNA-nicking Smr family endonuclease
MAPDQSDDAPLPLPITGELDLHTFRPSDVGKLIPAWLAECAAHGLREVRIVHGKGTGTLRTTVHALLRRSPLVQSFRLGDEHSGSWGATLVTLRL